VETDNKKNLTLKINKMSNHKHECKIGCGCYHPAIDLLINKIEVNKQKLEIPIPNQSNPPENNIFFNSKIYPIEKITESENPITSLDSFNTMFIEGNKVKWLGDIPYQHGMPDNEIQQLIISVSGIPENLVKSATLNNLEQKTILPGLIEPHCHIYPSAIIMNSGLFCDYSPFYNEETESGSQFLNINYSRAFVFKKIKNDVKNIEDGNWLIGYGVDPSLMSEVYPDKELTIENCIDKESFEKYLEIDPSIPILLISASMHTAYLNSEALNLTIAFMEDHKDIYDDTSINNIRISNGVLNELIEMTPAISAIKQIQQLEENPEKAKEITDDAITSYIDSAREKGITMLYDAGMKEVWAEDQFLGQDHGIRIGMSFLYDIFQSKETAKIQLDKFTNKNTFVTPEESNINAYWGSVKIVSDGSNQGLTGYQTHNYVCPTYHNGIDNFEEQTKLSHQPSSKGDRNRIDLIESIISKKWPILIHANGNDIVNKTISAYEEALDESTLSKGDFITLRNRIEHCSLLNASGIEKMQKLKILPSFLIGHVGYWGNVFNGYIFPENSEDNQASKHLDLCKTVIGANQLPISLHSDNGVSPLGPLRYAEQAITRIMEGNADVKDYYTNWTALKEKELKPTRNEFEDSTKNSVLNKDERLLLLQAIKAITIDAAYQCHADHLVGSLLPNKLADFVILEEDPMEMVDPYKAYLNMRAIKVAETWVGGFKYIDGKAEQQKTTLKLQPSMS